MGTPYYPDCSACGHNASGVVAFRCTAFVPYPDGDPRGLAGYCPCRCGDDPVIKAWLAVQVIYPGTAGITVTMPAYYGEARQLTGRPHITHCYVIHDHDVIKRACQHDHRSYRTAKACANRAARRLNQAQAKR